MSGSISGWDTKGVTGVGLLADGRINLEFTGKDGEKRNVFVPVEAVGPFIATVGGLAAKARETSVQIGQQLPGSFMLALKTCNVGADATGTQFVMEMVTRDGLGLRYAMDRTTMQSLAEGLAALLLKFGIAPAPPKSAGSAH